MVGRLEQQLGALALWEDLAALVRIEGNLWWNGEARCNSLETLVERENEAPRSREHRDSSERHALVSRDVVTYPAADPAPLYFLPCRP